MSGKISAFAVFKTKSKIKKNGNVKQLSHLSAGKQAKLQSFRNKNVTRKLKETNTHEATPYQLMNLTRSPKVYFPNFKSSSSDSSLLSPEVSNTTDFSSVDDTIDSSDAPKTLPNSKKKLKRKRLNSIRMLQNVESNSSKKIKSASVEFPSPYQFTFDSRLDGAKCFEWLLYPTKPDKFFQDLWEKRPLLVKRHNNNYFKGLFSMSQLNNILKNKNVWFGKNIDLTTYLNGKRETHNYSGRAFPSLVWDAYQNGCSVRMLNPQTFSTCIWKLNSTLQEFFGSFVGANVYLTPPGSQGFAPHYDDIEAFILQLEGSKRWRLYAPRTSKEILPRFSSGNFNDSEIGEPILDVLLETGDLLYFPRGTIHQAVSPPGSHSLHITLSTCQKNTWGDYLKLLIPQALETALEEDVKFRESVPLNFLQHLGVSNSDMETPERTQFINVIHKLMTKLIEYAPIDAAADQMAKKHIHEFLPPLLTKFEENHCVRGSGERWVNGLVVGASELEPDSRIKIIRAGILRLIMEEDSVRVYYYSENSREYQKEDAQFIEISPTLAPGVEYLCLSYPNWVRIEDLPLDDLESKMTISTILFDRGLILVEDIEPNVSA